MAADAKYDISQAKLVTFFTATKATKFTLTADEITKIKAL